ncbi:hypothetical protein AC579_9162 [Pseudocercospora musae]|uniref:Uncharacterized protein n=1 Tax=Pseudocercospora musae TaxID=113226 RepID=A0A139I6H4_9PEZI|nr:hypothetical protein AC579_9162 [Pseudocercospora musae]
MSCLLGRQSPGPGNVDAGLQKRTKVEDVVKPEQLVDVNERIVRGENLVQLCRGVQLLLYCRGEVRNRLKCTVFICRRHTRPARIVVRSFPSTM